jgi:hypothetical protein
MRGDSVLASACGDEFLIELSEASYRFPGI